MADSNLSTAVRAIGVDDDKNFARMAQAIAAPCVRDTTEIVGLIHDGSTEDGQKAAAVLLELGSHAFPTLLGAMKREPPEDYVWEAQILADIVIAARGRLVAKLEQMFEDEREVKMPDFGPTVEEKFPPRRVRDEAYLSTRKLLVTDASEDERYLDERAFLTRSYEERDLEIARYRQTRKWVPLSER